MLQPNTTKNVLKRGLVGMRVLVLATATLVLALVALLERRTGAEGVPGEGRGQGEHAGSSASTPGLGPSGPSDTMEGVDGSRARTAIDRPGGRPPTNLEVRVVEPSGASATGRIFLELDPTDEVIRFEGPSAMVPMPETPWSLRVFDPFGRRAGATSEDPGVRELDWDGVVVLQLAERPTLRIHCAGVAVRDAGAEVVFTPSDSADQDRPIGRLNDAELSCAHPGEGWLHLALGGEQIGDAVPLSHEDRSVSLAPWDADATPLALTLRGAEAGDATGVPISLTHVQSGFQRPLVMTVGARVEVRVAEGTYSVRCDEPRLEFIGRDERPLFDAGLTFLHSTERPADVEIDVRSRRGWTLVSSSDSPLDRTGLPWRGTAFLQRNGKWVKARDLEVSFAEGEGPGWRGFLDGATFSPEWVDQRMLRVDLTAPSGAVTSIAPVVLATEQEIHLELGTDPATTVRCFDGAGRVLHPRLRLKSPGSERPRSLSRDGRGGVRVRTAELAGDRLEAQLLGGRDWFPLRPRPGSAPPSGWVDLECPSSASLLLHIRPTSPMRGVELLDERGKAMTRFRRLESEDGITVVWAGLAPGEYRLTRRGTANGARALRHPITLGIGATMQLDSSELTLEDWRLLKFVAGLGVTSADRLRFESIADSKGPGTTILDPLELEQECLAGSVLLPPEWHGPGRSIRCTLLVGGLGPVEIQRLRPGDGLEPIRIGSVQPRLSDEAIQRVRRDRTDGRRSRWLRPGLRGGDGCVRLPAGAWTVELIGPGGERTVQTEVVPGETTGL